ncbi:50S ribosomal protein L23 [Candidatus Microgenomates bacterium]|nr:MAG: 50S ribosomal protein L23 [Candidatus Microgenomates bacterium]
MLKPVLTEKSLGEAKKGKFTFLVDNSLSKYQIRDLVSKAFGVKVVSVRSSNKKGSTRKSLMGKFITKKAIKKASVEVVEKDRAKIDVFGGDK